MPRKAEGQVTKTADGYSARITIRKTRPTFALIVTSDNDAAARAEMLATMARRLTKAPQGLSDDEIKKALDWVASASTSERLARATAMVDELAGGETTRAASVASPTFAKFAEDWTSGALQKKHPDHVRVKDSTRDEENLRLYINDVIGPKRIADITLEDAERVMAKLPSKLRPRSRRHVAQCMRKVLAYAVYPGRYLAHNPIPKEWMPKIPKSSNRAKAHLWPAEDARLLGAREIPVSRRLVYGLLVREGMRADELASLRWRDLDLDNGRIRLDENKTDDPRAWALSSDVWRTLQWWRDYRDVDVEEDADELVIGLDLHEGSRWLRGRDPHKAGEPKADYGDLGRAGVMRRELFEKSFSRQPIRLHDLRASFVTVSLANGKTEQWVTDRTGHRSSQMLAAYTRQARTWAELDLGTFGALDVLLPETREPLPEKAVKRRKKVGERGLEPRANGLRDGARILRSDADARNTPDFDPKGTENQRGKTSSVFSPPFQSDLEKALALAVEARDLDLVKRIMSEIELRRRESAGAIDLAVERKRRGGK